MDENENTFRDLVSFTNKLIATVLMLCLCKSRFYVSQSRPLFGNSIYICTLQIVKFNFSEFILRINQLLRIFVILLLKHWKIPFDQLCNLWSMIELKKNPVLFTKTTGMILKSTMVPNGWNQPEINSLDVISQVFFKKCPAFPFPEIGSISMISQFHDFLAGFYYLAQLCVAAGMILKSISRKHNGFPPIVWHQLCPRSSALWSKNSAGHNYGDLSLT